MIKYLKFSLATRGLFLFLLLLASLAPCFASAQETVYLVVRAGTADVHLYPNSTSDLVGTLPAGVTVLVSETRPGWYRVRLPKAETERAARYGWIPAELVTLTLSPPVAAEPAPSVPPGAAPLSLRTAPADVPPAAKSASHGTRSRADFLVTIGAGGTKDDRISGGAATFGAGVKTGPLVVTFTAADLVLAPGDTYPYYRDTFDNGQSRCRSSLNGQFAEDTNCQAVDVTYALSLDGQIFIPHTPVTVGVGRRFGPQDRDLWFGSVGWYWEAASRRFIVTVKGQFGDSYISGLATLAVRIPK